MLRLRRVEIFGFCVYISPMTNNISEFSRFTYLDENFQDLRDYCEDKGIWICQSLRRKGPLTFALARNEEVASELSARFS